MARGTGSAMPPAAKTKGATLQRTPKAKTRVIRNLGYIMLLSSSNSNPIGIGFARCATAGYCVIARRAPRQSYLLLNRARFMPEPDLGISVSAASRHLVAPAFESILHHCDACNIQVYHFDRNKQTLLVWRLS